ncbi:MAG TPA: hypothetical protein DCX22_01980 [Dehalococcoidia bacterium]|nr:hypothetical protein [Dehalococcoidia bacterium]
MRENKQATTQIELPKRLNAEQSSKLPKRAGLPICSACGQLIEGGIPLRDNHVYQTKPKLWDAAADRLDHMKLGELFQGIPVCSACGNLIFPWCTQNRSIGGKVDGTSKVRGHTVSITGGLAD